MSIENENLVRRYMNEAFNNGNMSILDETISENYVNHDPANQVSGIAGLRDVITKYRDAFPDLQMNFDDIFSSGDKVTVRWSWSGTQNGQFEDTAPTGKRVEGTGILIGRISGEKIEEAWVNWDTLGMLQQLGVVQG